VKFFATSFLLFIYLFASSGVQVKVHYCGKRISSVKVFSVEETKCCCKKKKNVKSKCCSDKEFQVKLNEAQNIASAEIVSNPKTFLSTIFIQPELFVFNVFGNEIVHHHANAPPLLYSKQIYLLNSVFRI